MRTFLDTSALVKLYRIEPNSAAVQAHLLPEDDLLLCQTTPLEFRSAFYGMVRQRILTLAEAQTYITSFEVDWFQYILVPLDNAAFNRTQTLLDTYAVSDSLRPLDAFQSACVLEEHARSGVDTFLTTDHTLARVAALCGLNVKP